jgi:hypothetical protein
MSMPTLVSDHHAVPHAPRLDPAADDGFGLAALIAFLPGGIDVGRVDESQFRLETAVEEAERGRLVDRQPNTLPPTHKGGTRSSDRPS